MNKTKWVDRMKTWCIAVLLLLGTLLWVLISKKLYRRWPAAAAKWLWQALLGAAAVLGLGFGFGLGLALAWKVLPLTIQLTLGPGAA